MLNLRALAPAASSVLLLGAHSDDIEIGCGGTILRLLGERDDVHVTWVVFGSTPSRTAEAISSANAFLAKAHAKSIAVKEFRDGFFPYLGGEIKEHFEELKCTVAPDVVFTHYLDDRHQDHRIISDLTWNTFRSHLILEYEIPKYDGDLGHPNLFVRLDEPTCRAKVKHLMDHFRTQANKHWFTEETFMSLMRLRGIEANVATTYAEAFYCRKLTL